MTQHEPEPTLGMWRRIDDTMTQEQLLNLRPRGAKSVILLPDGEKYKAHEYLAHDVAVFVGINGKVKFI